MGLVIGGKAYTPSAPAPLDMDAAEERAMQHFQAGWEAVKEITFLERRLEKRWRWLQSHLDEQDTEKWKSRNADVHDDFANKHGAWRRLVKASAALQEELSRWPPKRRELWCQCWGVDYPCEVFAHQMETDLEWTPWAGVPPY